MPHKTLRNYSSSARVRFSEKVMHFVFFLLCISPLAVAALLSTDGNFCTFHLFGLSVPLRGVCFFRLITGYRCPVCGMTRCFTYMSHGNIAAAWHMSHAGVPLYLLCIYESVYRLLLMIFAKFAFYRVFKVIEIVLLVIVCAAVAFFFVAQFVYPAIVG